MKNVLCGECVKLVVVLKEGCDDYDNYSAEDFEPGEGITIQDYKVSGDNDDILNFILEGYFSDINQLATNFAETFEYEDYEIENIS